MKKYLVSVPTKFWVYADSEEDACDKALEQMPLSDLDFDIEREEEVEEDEA